MVNRGPGTRPESPWIRLVGRSQIVRSTPGSSTLDEAGIEQIFRWVLGEKLHSPVTGRLYIADDMCEQVRQEYFDIRPLVEDDPNCDKLTLGSYRALGWLIEVALVDPIDWR